MAELILPDSRLETPSLFYPKRKPVGKVKIDWGHPLARGLTLCLLMQGNTVIDLVTGRKATLFGNADWIPDGIHFDEVNSYFTVPEVRFDSKFTISWNATPDDNDGALYQYLLSTGAYGSANSINILLNEDSQGADAGKLSIVGDNGADSAILKTALLYPALSAKDCSFKANARDVELFTGGKSAGSINQWGGTTPPIADNTIKTLYVGARVDLNVDRMYGGSMRYVFIHDHDLADSKIQRLHANPYQFIIPE